MTFADALQSLEPVGGTAAGRYYRLEGEIYAALPNPGYIQTGEGARRPLDELDRLAHARGKKCVLIVLVDRVASQDPESRRVWSSHRPGETRCGQALVCGNVLARAIGSFFLGLNRGAVPTRMFPNLEQAVAWSREMVETHGGSLG